MARIILNGFWNKKMTALHEALAVEKTLVNEDKSYLAEWRKIDRRKKYERCDVIRAAPSTYSLQGSLSTRSSYEVSRTFLYHHGNDNHSNDNLSNDSREIHIHAFF